MLPSSNKSLGIYTMEEKMKRSILVLGSLLSFSTTVFSTENPFKNPFISDLNSSIKKKPGFVAYIKDVLNVPNRDAVMEDILFPNKNHHDINFGDITQQVFDDNYWIPKQDTFTDSKIEELFFGYKPKLKDIDNFNIFLANLLYAAGDQFYNATKNSEFLEYAASVGHPRAQYAMFSISLKSKEFSAARNYILSAAAQKNPDALLKLSEIYQGGYQRLSFSEDLEMARKFCKEAENLGNKEAEFRIQVATLTEGFFGSEINYQEGILKAKELADAGNKRAKKFIKAIMNSSGDALMEGNEAITYEDLDFLREYLGWKDETDY